jgi:hypothetical protein
MTQDEVLENLNLYFPGLFVKSSPFLNSEAGRILLQRLLTMPTDPVTLTQFNQLLHLANEIGVSDGFFRYYFLTLPGRHPYALDRVFDKVPGLNESGVSSLEQLKWGLHRFFIDSLLYFGDIRTAYEELHGKSHPELERFFAGKRVDSEGMRARGPALPLHQIPADDRYLIAEIACKGYSPIADGAELLIEDVLLKAYKARGGGTVRIGDLFGEGSQLARDDPQTQYMLQFTTEEFVEDTVSNENDIRERVHGVAGRFVKARDLAVANTRLYLSLVNELDVYVATSMRKRSDFRDMNRDCGYIFGEDQLSRFRIRYFDPTLSAAEGHEDKGLIECLMVKRAKALVYFAGEADSFGKDAEVTMALSLGKPVIILCPSTAKGEQRRRFFRDTHPLSRMVHMETGIAVGSIVTNDTAAVARLLERLFDNRMEYDLEQRGDSYFRLKDRLTGSVVRLQTNFLMLRESFWNYYHKVP